MSLSVSIPMVPLDLKDGLLKSAFARYMAGFRSGFRQNIQQKHAEVNSVNLGGAKPPADRYIPALFRPFTHPFNIP